MKLHVMHVPGRVPERDQAVRRLHGEVEVCLHTDKAMRGPAATHSDCLRCAAKNDTGPWSFVGQDDLRLLDGWETELEGALDNSPSPLLSLVNVGAEARKAAEIGAAYEVGPYVTRGAFVAYRQEVVKPVSRFLTFAGYAGFEGDDVAVNIWAALNGITPARVTRSLGLHFGAKSLIGHRQDLETVRHIQTPDLRHIEWESAVKPPRTSETRNDVADLLRLMETCGWKPTEGEQERREGLGWLA